MESLGEIVKNKRNELNMSQKELAEKIGVNDSYITKIEKGITAKPSPNILYQLCVELNLNFFKLLKKTGYSNVEIFELTDIGLNLTNDIRIINVVGRKNLKEYIIENGDGVFLDIEKVLNSYKNNKIDLEKAIELIDLCVPLYTEGKRTYFTESGAFTFDDNINDDIIIEDITDDMIIND